MNSFIKDTIWVYIGSFATIPITYLIKILYAQNLSLSDYGIFFGLASFFNFFNFLRDLGLGAASMYFTHKYIVEKNLDKVKTLYYINQLTQLFLSIIIAILLYFLKIYIFEIFYKNDPNISKIFDIYLLFWVTSTILDSNIVYLSIFQNQKAVTFLNLFRWLITLILSYFLFDKITIYLVPPIAYFTSTLFISLISYIYIKLKYKEYLSKPKINIDKNLIKEVFKYALSIIIAGVSATLLISTDTVIIQYFLGASSVAIYTTAISIVSILSIIISPFINVLQPKIAQLWHQKDIKSIENLLTFLINNFLIFLLPTSISISIFAKNIILALFSEKFLDSTQIIQLMTVFMNIPILSSFLYAILSAIGKPKEISFITLYVGIFNFLGNIILINFYGLIGISISTIFSWILGFWLLYNILKKEINIRYDTLNILKIIFSSIFFAITNVFLLNHIYVFYTDIYLINFIINGFIIFSLSFLIYLLILFLTNVLNIEKIKYAIKLAFSNK